MLELSIPFIIVLSLNFEKLRLLITAIRSILPVQGHNIPVNCFDVHFSPRRQADVNSLYHKTDLHSDFAPTIVATEV